MSKTIDTSSASGPRTGPAEGAGPSTTSTREGLVYEKPQVKTLSQRDVLSAVKKGSKFPARGFAG